MTFQLQLKPEYEQLCINVEVMDTDNFGDLIAQSGLDRTSDFRHSDLRNVDFSNSDVSGFDFTGADLSNSHGINICGMSRAIFSGATTTNSPFVFAAEINNAVEKSPELAVQLRRASNADWMSQHSLLAQSSYEAAKGDLSNIILGKQIIAEAKDLSVLVMATYCLNDFFKSRREVIELLKYVVATKPEASLLTEQIAMLAAEKHFWSAEQFDFLMDLLIGKNFKTSSFAFAGIIRAKWEAEQRRKFCGLITSAKFQGYRKQYFRLLIDKYPKKFVRDTFKRMSQNFDFLTSEISSTYWGTIKQNLKGVAGGPTSYFLRSIVELDVNYGVKLTIDQEVKDSITEYDRKLEEVYELTKFDRNFFVAHQKVELPKWPKRLLESN